MVDRVQSKQFDGDRSRWAPIDYRDYWDFARLFSVEYKGLHFVFDAPFLELSDDYSDFFLVYFSRNPAGSWEKEYTDWGLSGIFPVSAITMDESRKRYVLIESLDRIFKNFDPTAE